MESRPALGQFAVGIAIDEMRHLYHGHSVDRVGPQECGPTLFSLTGVDVACDPKCGESRFPVDYGRVTPNRWWAFFRRLTKRKNRSAVITAPARKLVTIAYLMLNHNERNAPRDSPTTR